MSDRLVYSSGPRGADASCEACRADPCRCERVASLPPSCHEVRVGRERKGRRGKTVTVAGPFELTREDAATLLGSLKRACGSGGTARRELDRDGRRVVRLEIQGDHVERTVALLAGLGYRATAAGGRS